MELCEPCLGENVQSIEMLVVSRDHVRFVFSRTVGKLEVVVLQESGSVRMVSKPLCSNLFDCNWAIEVVLRQRVVVHHYVHIARYKPILFGAIRDTSKPEF
jgi:hypothetical protein